MGVAIASKAFAVRYGDFYRWDVKAYANWLNSVYPIVELGPYITEHNEKVKLNENPENTFQILGVTNTDGIFHAYDIKGSKVKQSYKKVNTGDFAYNPYRVNVGSVGIVPDELRGGYISPAYVVWMVDESKVIPKLLFLILKSAWFNPYLRAATAGSVRQNLTFDLLGTLRIPLPPYPVQQGIIARWQIAQDEIEQAKNRIKQIKRQVYIQFYRDLGLKPLDDIVPLKYFAVEWNALSRWGVNFNQYNQAGFDLTHGKYPVIQLGELIEKMQYGTSTKANTIGKGVPIIRMNNIVDGFLDFTDIKHVMLNKSERDKLFLFKGDILFNRTNSKELVGKCAVFNAENNKYVFASYLIKVKVDFDKLSPNYASFVINSPIGRQQIDTLSRQIIGQANINTKEISSLEIPLPPMDIQNALMEMVSTRQSLIIEEQNFIRQRAIEIENELEDFILGRKNITA